MYLAHVLNSLKYGEFSKLSIGGQDQGVINQANYSELATHINNGLIALFTRFLLKESVQELALISGVYTYSIAKPNFIKVQRIYGDTDHEFVLNNLGDRYSILNETVSVINVPRAVVDKPDSLPKDLLTDTLRIVYRAKPTPLDTDSAGFFDAEDLELELPDSYLDALLYYVASRVSNGFEGNHVFHAGNNYAAKYEAACKQLEMSNVQVDRAGSEDRLTRNGWV